MPASKHNRISDDDARTARRQPQSRGRQSGQQPERGSARQHPAERRGDNAPDTRADMPQRPPEDPADALMQGGD